MIKIKIDRVEQDLSRTNENWICEQIERRKKAGRMVCVQVTIKEGDLHLTLATPACSRGLGGGRQPNRREQKVLELWQEHGLNEHNFTVQGLIAFLHRFTGQNCR